MINKKIKHYLKKSYRRNASNIDYIFRESCRYGEIEMVKYIFNHSLYSHHILFDHSETDYDSPLVLASCNGHLNIIKFLLEHKKENFNISDCDNRAIRLACNNGHLKIIKYLLHSKKIKENARLDYFSLNSAYNRKFENVVSYLLKHAEIEDLEPMTNYIYTTPERIKMFKDMRNSLILSEKLEKTMDNRNNNTSQRIKV